MCVCADIALMKNNAVVGSQIAVELASLRRGQRSQQLFTATTHAQKRPVGVIVCYCAVVNLLFVLRTRLLLERLTSI